jgi:arylsulfatase A-like enzyme
VEIRDILPTLAAAAGIAVPESCDGQNILKARRDWIDLEHDVCYSETNHWTALTDGRWKYIFHAFDGSEQLFDLSADPAETADLSGDPAHSTTLRNWRGRMAGHLAMRGDRWVRNGAPAVRPGSMRHSPNYPQPAGPEPPVGSRRSVRGH